MRAFPNRYLLVLAFAVGLLLVGCPESWKRLDKPPTTSVWVDPQRAVPAVEEVGPLTQGGELFLEYGRLDWDGSRPSVVVGERVELPARTTVTLVMSGPWPRGLGDHKAAGEALGRELTNATLQAEGRGLRVVGVHLDCLDVGDLEGYSEGLKAIQGEMPADTFLSVTLPRPWLDRDAAQAVADAVDFLVAPLYGQRPGSSPWDPAWTLEHVLEDAWQVNALGQDFLIGIQTVGVAILDPKGGAAGVRTRGSLRELALSPALELVPGFSLSGIDARRYTFRSRGTVRFGGETLTLGQTLDVLGLGVTHIQDLRSSLRHAGLEHLRGEIFYRLPAPEERFLLGREQVAALLGGDVPAPALASAVELRDRRGRLYRFFVTLTNSGQQATEIALVDHNYLELVALDGYFSNADRGQFQRYQLLSRGQDGQTRATLRRANVLRLFQPMLDVGDQVTSGLVQLVATGNDPRVRLEAAFVLPDGEMLTLPGEEWRP